MSIETAPAFRVLSAQTHLHRARRYGDAASAAEYFADALLAELANALRVGAKAPTKVELADAVQAAEEAALKLADAALCPCGHLFAEHVARHGCLGFDCACTARRPHATEAVPEVAR